MTLKEFVEKYKGVAVDFDGAYGAQCVDLVRKYMKEVWGFTRQPEGVNGAEEFYFKHDRRPIQRELCNCAPYTGSMQPPVGALLVFKPSDTNEFGHIAICLETTHKCLTVLEQDGVTNARNLKEGKPQKGAYISVWGYERLAGWLTKKEAG